MEENKESPTQDHQILESISEIFEANDVPLAIAAYITDDGKLQFWFRGHFYDAAKIVAELYKQIKQKVGEDLGES